MFLTTEPSIPGTAYSRLRIITGAGYQYVGSSSETKVAQGWNTAVGQALATIECEVVRLGADGVIGVHLSTSETGAYFHAVVMGTAIKFQTP